MKADGIHVFHKGAVLAWGRSIGIPDATAISFMQKAGAIVVDDTESSKPVL